MLSDAQVATSSGGGHDAQLHVGVRVDAVLGEVVAQQEVVDRVVEGDAELEALPLLGSRLSLCLLCRTMAWPLMFWMVATYHRLRHRAEAHEIATRHGREEVAGVVLLESILSRISAQPAVFSA